MFKSRLGRSFGFNFAISSILDIALAYVIATFFDSADFWIAFFLILAVIWFVPLIFLLKVNIYKLLLQQLNKTSIRTFLVQSFREAQLPLLSGTNFNDPADLYFQNVEDDDELPKSARRYAGATIGQMSIINHYSIIDAFAFHSNLDAALAQYFDEMRRDGVKPNGLDRKDAELDDIQNVSDLNEQAELVIKAKLKSDIGRMSAKVLSEKGIGEVQMKYERERYLGSRREIEELLELINDSFYFAAAFHQYAKLVCAADEPKLVVQYLSKVDKTFLNDIILPDLPDLAPFAASENKL